jgi:hypothetical protein
LLALILLKQELKNSNSKQWKFNLTLRRIAMFDLTRARYTYTKEVPVVAGAEIENEGAFAKIVLVNGAEAAELATGAAGEAIGGFTINSNIVPGERVIVDTDTVPAQGAAVVRLSNGNLVAGQILALDVAAGTVLTVVTTGVPTATQVLVDYKAGTLTFNAAMAGKVVQVRYRYALTVQEQAIIFRQRPINFGQNTAAGTITLARGIGEVYTDQYDVTVDFSQHVGELYVTAGGLVTTDNAGSAIPGSRVTKVPTAADPFLGLTFTIA